MAFTDAEALAYIASYADLRAAFGPDPEAGRRHFAAFGQGEGRSILFNPFAYIASYPDLIRASGADAAAGARHFINFGANEGRSISFNALAYIAAYPDLAAAFGSDASAGAAHFITNADNEGRVLRFDGLRYVSSNPDLLAAFGLNAEAGIRHYLQFGRFEERGPAVINPLEYIAAYSDLTAAFGADAQAGLTHYARFGFAEGRTSRFDPQAYWLENPDLAAAGLQPDDVLAHYFNFGFREGRAALPFGDAQTVTAASVGRVVRETFSDAGDSDHFAITLTGGQAIRVNLLSEEEDLRAVDGATVELRDSANQLVEAYNVIGPAARVWMPFTAPTDGVYSLVLRAPGTLSGAATYALAVAPAQVSFASDIVTFEGDDASNAIWADAPFSAELRVIETGAGDDVLVGIGFNVLLRGGAGADLLIADAASAMVTYTTSATGVIVDLTTGLASGGDAQGDRFVGITSLRGSRVNDQLTGSAGRNRLEGLEGDDLLVGLDGDDILNGGVPGLPIGSGNDTLLGGFGNDLLLPGDGADVVDGGPGTDTVLFIESAVRVDLRSGLAQGGEAEGDTYTAVESIRKGDLAAGNDVLATTTAGGSLFGGGGDDILIGRGPGLVEGGTGDDLLVGRGQMLGGDGDDTIVGLGGFGEILLQGDAGADLLIVSTALNPGGSTYRIAARIALGEAGDHIDLSGFERADGSALAFADVQSRLQATGSIFEGFAVQRLPMNDFRTAAGDQVSGYLEFVAAFEEAQFIFSGGLDWQPLVPSDFPIT